jgi:nucleotide-binding universal stress UspA family protein
MSATIPDLRGESMNIHKILFPTDFSHYNDAALKLASTLAAEADATLYIAHVDELRDLAAAMGEAGYLMTATIGERTEVKEQLKRVRPTVPAVKYEHLYRKGSPVVEILCLAEEENIDLIVMASHGRTGLTRILMGSIAEGVMRKARCPVLVVKQPSGERESADDAGAVVTKNQANAVVAGELLERRPRHTASPALQGMHTTRSAKCDSVE